MNSRRFTIRTRPLLLLLLLAIGLGAAACSTTDDDPDNQSVKPWNSPEGWQNGNMQMLQQQQH
jgi:ABC-type glycerol-3-phosphate transport system substrate-binding protein